MNGIKATIILCVTLLVLLTMYLWYQPFHQRFTLVGNQKEGGVFIFDQDYQHLQYCPTQDTCVTVAFDSSYELDHQPTSHAMAHMPVTTKQKAAKAPAAVLAKETDAETAGADQPAETASADQQDESTGADQPAEAAPAEAAPADSTNG